MASAIVMAMFAKLTVWTWTLLMVLCPLLPPQTAFSQQVIIGLIDHISQHEQGEQGTEVCSRSREHASVPCSRSLGRRRIPRRRRPSPYARCSASTTLRSVSREKPSTVASQRPVVPSTLPRSTMNR